MNKKLISTVIVGVLLSLLVVSMAFAESGSFEITAVADPTVVGVDAFAFDPTEDELTLGSDLLFTGAQDGFAILDATGTNAGWIFSCSFSDFYSEGTIDNPVSANGDDILDVYIASADWISFTVTDAFGSVMSDATTVRDLQAEPFTSFLIADDGVNTTFPTTTLPDDESIGTAIEGSPADPANISFDLLALTDSVKKDTVSTTTLSMIEVEPGYGAGAYVFNLDFNITIDEWLPEGSVIDARDTNEAATTGDDAETDGAVDDDRFDDHTVAAGDVTANADRIQVFAGVYESNFVYSISSNPAT